MLPMKPSSKAIVANWLETSYCSRRHETSPPQGPIRSSDDALRQMIVGPQPAPFQLTPSQRAVRSLNSASRGSLRRTPGSDRRARKRQRRNGLGHIGTRSEGKNPSAMKRGTCSAVGHGGQQCNRLVRLITARRAARLRISIETRLDTGHNPANLIGRTAGKREADEVMMFGAPIDSSHAAAGTSRQCFGPSSRRWRRFASSPR